MESTSNSSESSNPPLTPEEQLTERERAIALLGFLPERKHLTIYCARTGVAIATLELLQQAGRLPYLANWKDSQAYHPLFSLSQASLLAWTRKNWNQLFRNKASDFVTDVQKQQFQIAFIAILHSLNCIDQQCPALPEFNTVVVHLQRLLELAYWYNYLDSRRFRFPTLRINRLNANDNLKDIGAYFDICDSIRKDWETSRDARLEDVKLEAARRAEKAVRGTHVKAVSKKMLWNWFKASLTASNSRKYELPEWKEWRADSEKLWFASENGQLQFTLDDVNSLEEVFLCECTLGTAVSHAFQAELSRIREHIETHQKLWNFDPLTDIIDRVKRVDSDGNVLGTSNIEQTAPPEPGPMPGQGDFPHRVEYIRAKALWEVRRMKWKAWQERFGSNSEE